MPIDFSGLERSRQRRRESSLDRLDAETLEGVFDDMRSNEVFQREVGAGNDAAANSVLETHIRRAAGLGPDDALPGVVDWRRMAEWRAERRNPVVNAALGLGRAATELPRQIGRTVHRGDALLTDTIGRGLEAAGAEAVGGALRGHAENVRGAIREGVGKDRIREEEDFGTVSGTVFGRIPGYLLPTDPISLLFMPVKGAATATRLAGAASGAGRASRFLTMTAPSIERIRAASGAARVAAAGERAGVAAGRGLGMSGRGIRAAGNVGRGAALAGTSGAIEGGFDAIDQGRPSSLFIGATAGVVLGGALEAGMTRLSKRLAARGRTRQTFRDLPAANLAERRDLMRGVRDITNNIFDLLPEGTQRTRREVRDHVVAELISGKKVDDLADAVSQTGARRAEEIARINDDIVMRIASLTDEARDSADLVRGLDEDIVDAMRRAGEAQKYAAEAEAIARQTAVEHVDDLIARSSERVGRLREVAAGLRRGSEQLVGSVNDNSKRVIARFADLYEQLDDITIGPKGGRRPDSPRLRADRAAIDREVARLAADYPREAMAVMRFADDAIDQGAGYIDDVLAQGARRLSAGADGADALTPGMARQMAAAGDEMGIRAQALEVDAGAEAARLADLEDARVRAAQSGLAPEPSLKVRTNQAIADAAREGAVEARREVSGLRAAREGAVANIREIRSEINKLRQQRAMLGNDPEAKDIVDELFKAAEDVIEAVNGGKMPEAVDEAAAELAQRQARSRSAASGKASEEAAAPVFEEGKFVRISEGRRFLSKKARAHNLEVAKKAMAENGGLFDFEEYLATIGFVDKGRRARQVTRHLNDLSDALVKEQMRLSDIAESVTKDAQRMKGSIGLQEFTRRMEYETANKSPIMHSVWQGLNKVISGINAGTGSVREVLAQTSPQMLRAAEQITGLRLKMQHEISPMLATLSGIGKGHMGWNHVFDKQTRAMMRQFNSRAELIAHMKKLAQQASGPRRDAILRHIQATEEALDTVLGWQRKIHGVKGQWESFSPDYIPRALISGKKREAMDAIHAAITRSGSTTSLDHFNAAVSRRLKSIGKHGGSMADLGDHDLNIVLNEVLRYRPRKSTKAASEHARVVREIDDSLTKYYADLPETLHYHAESLARRVSEQEVLMDLMKKQRVRALLSDDQLTSEGINSLITSPDDVSGVLAEAFADTWNRRDAVKAMSSFLSEGDSMNGFFAMLRDLGYASTLGQIHSSMIQFEDIAWRVAFDPSSIKFFKMRDATLSAWGYKNVRGSELTMAPLEFARSATTRNWHQNIAHYSMMPFSTLDAGIRSRIASGILERGHRLASEDSAAGKAFRANIFTRYGSDAEGMLAALKAREGKDHRVLGWMLAEIGMQQPTTRLDVPVAYQGNARILYQLKTFALRRMAFAYNVAKDELIGSALTMRELRKAGKLTPDMEQALRFSMRRSFYRLTVPAITSAVFGAGYSLLKDRMNDRDTDMFVTGRDSVLSAVGLNRNAVGIIANFIPVGALETEEDAKRRRRRSATDQVIDYLLPPMASIGPGMIRDFRKLMEEEEPGLAEERKRHAAFVRLLGPLPMIGQPARTYLQHSTEYGDNEARGRRVD